MSWIRFLSPDRVFSRRVESFEPKNPHPNPQNFSQLEKDTYIPPEGETTPTQQPHNQIKKEGHWWGRFFSKQAVHQEVIPLVAKLDRLATAPTQATIYFLENDFPRLASLAEQHPEIVQPLLERTLVDSAHREESEPWFLLAGIAAGDNEAFLKAIELLGG